MSTTYSLAQLWNVDVTGLERITASDPLEAGFPVDGDAHLRQRAQLEADTRRTNTAWSKVRAAVLARHDVDNCTPLRISPGEAAAARDDYRATMSAHTATVLAGGDLSTLEPTC